MILIDINHELLNFRSWSVIFNKMASELIKKFDEIQEQKHGKKEIQIDEFEWIEVNKIRNLKWKFFSDKKIILAQ